MAAALHSPSNHSNLTASLQPPNPLSSASSSPSRRAAALTAIPEIPLASLPPSASSPPPPRATTFTLPPPSPPSHARRSPSPSHPGSSSSPPLPRAAAIVNHHSPTASLTNTLQVPDAATSLSITAVADSDILYPHLQIDPLRSIDSHHQTLRRSRCSHHSLHRWPSVLDTSPNSINLRILCLDTTAALPSAVLSTPTSTTPPSTTTTSSTINLTATSCVRCCKGDLREEFGSRRRSWGGAQSCCCCFDVQNQRRRKGCWVMLLDVGSWVLFAMGERQRGVVVLREGEGLDC